MKESRKKGGNPNPILTANPLSKLFLTWIWSLFVKGFGGTLTQESLWDVTPEDEAERNGDLLEKNFKAHLEQNEGTPSEPEAVPFISNGHTSRHDDVEMKPIQNGVNHDHVIEDVVVDDDGYKTLLRALLTTFGFQYFILWPFMAFTDCFLRVIQPWFLLCLIRSFLEEDFDPSAQYGYAAGVCLTTLAITLTNNPCLLRMGRLGLRSRIALNSLIQRKMTRLSQVGEGTNQGQLVTLVSSDTGRLETNMQNVPYILIGPLQLSFFMFFLWPEFGWSSLAGVAFILLFIPFQFWNGSLSTKYRGSIGRATDERTRALGEMINGINAIKMYAWENVFQGILQKSRKSEVKELRKRSQLHAIQMSIFLTSSRLVPFLTFMAFVLGGGPLTADRVFYAVAVYNTCTHYIGFMVPAGIRGIGEIKGSLKRIQNFLLLPEKRTNAKLYKHEKKNPDGRPPSVQLNSVTASWPSNETQAPPFRLDLDELTMKGHKLVMVVGDVGSGKSSLFHLTLAELPLKTGTCKIQGQMSYASQVPCIFSGSIRDNIVFNEEWDEDRYQEVIRAAALTADLDSFEHGDRTLVGERGTTLSGGQRARVNLARALYRRAVIYLLDDPLSAVDSQVSRTIFEECLGKDGILKEKLRILVTHQLQYLPQADYVVIMEKGRIKAQGTYDDLVQSNIDLSQLRHTGDDQVDNLVGQSNPKKMQAVKNESDDEPEAEQEKQLEGSLGFKTYWKYFGVGNALCQFSVYLLLFLISQVFITFIEYWLALWTNVEERLLEQNLKMPLPSATEDEILMNFELDSDILETNGSTIQSTTDTLLHQKLEANLTLSSNNELTYLTSLDQQMYLYVYTGLTLAIFLTNLAKAVTFFHYCMKASSNIHKKMLNSLVAARPQFFEQNPSGRIMNRFGKDIGVIDEEIPFKFFDMFTIFLQIETVIFLIILAIWYAFFPILVFLVALWFVRRYYVATSRDLKRIDGISRSPVYSQLTSSFNGLTTIRAFEAESANSSHFDHLQDVNTTSAFLFIAASRCFDIWIESIAIFLLTFVTFGFLLAQNYLGMTFLSGNVGLAICSAMSLTNWLQYGMRTSADVENLMISVERAVQYTKLETENSGEKGFTPPENWPATGKIQFLNVNLRYNPKSTYVLKNVNFEVESGEKLGIVGMTGAGKSSIFRAVFWMTKPEGVINIDSVPINRLGVQTLRQKISIIPQEAVLFQNTLRFNLDPTETVTDIDMHTVLRQLNLQHTVDFEVEEGGKNLSVGQRQLVSLARALLRKTKIVCLDEATANVDSSTDTEIQKILRKELATSTVITIAHRLHTIIDSDRILVMENGSVAELGPPHLLLQNPDSAFSCMVRATGKETEATLRKIAAERYEMTRRA